MTTLDLAAIEAARDRIRSLVVRTPLVRLGVDDAPAEIYLKLENLQPTGFASAALGRRFRTK